MADLSEYAELQRKAKLRQETEEEKYKKVSILRLKQTVEKQIRTTMIGALQALENNFGHLWGQGKDRPSVEELEHEEVYQRTRQEILDNGNKQIRNFNTELQQYEVTWKRHQLVLPVKEGRNDGQ